MSKAPNRCHYEVIGLPITCTQDEIRSAYKKLALRRHPDKLVQSGAISSAEATAAFQELAHAYEVLSDPKERHWYDSHRIRILFSDHSGSDASSPAGIPNLFSYFSRSCYTDYTDPKKGFYKVYSDVFDKIFANEIKHAKALGLGLGSVKEAPLMGDLKSPYTQVNAFYGYWLGFRSVMEFGWVYKWRDASAGTNRKLRRMMEEDNKKLRKKAMREFNEIVRGLAEFVKKRDKRVIDMMVMKEKEREKKREEDMERRKKMEWEKLEKANMYKEAEWAHVQEDEIHDIEEDEEEEEEEEERKEWYCPACRKKFKSDKQWRNHEQSKKHKEKVAELKASFTGEDENFENVERDEVDGEEFVQQNEVFESNVADGSFRSAEDHVSDLEEAFKDGVSIQEEENGGELSPGTDDNDVEEPYKEEKEFKQEMSIQEEESGVELLLGTEDSNNVGEPKREEKSIMRDDETSILKAMISGHKMKKHGTVKKQPKAPSARKVHIDSENKEEIVMEYSNRKKGSRKSRRAKGVKAKNSQESALEANVDHANLLNEENGMQNNVEAHSGGIKSEENLEDNVNYKGSKSNRFNKAKKSSRSTKQKPCRVEQSNQNLYVCNAGKNSNQVHKHLEDRSCIIENKIMERVF